jgi:uncharacterized protein with HEPN domain
MTKDKVYLKHILDTIGNIDQFANNLSQEEFYHNIEKQYAVLRALEVIGEATKNLSTELKTKYPEVDWRRIAGMRDKLIHAYFVVDLPLIWETIQNDIPRLKHQITTILATFS